MPRITPDHLDASRDEADFAFWWFSSAEDVTPRPGEGYYDYSKRVARLAWMSSARRARQNG
jgi:hypothetical protein